MNYYVKTFLFLLVLNAFTSIRVQGIEIEQGPYTPGFRLIESLDYSRTFPQGINNSPQARKVRIYLWYPSSGTKNELMNFNSYIKIAKSDFNAKTTPDSSKVLPVQLIKGLTEEQRKNLWERPMTSVRNAEPAEGSFPLIVLGQGLYYESPVAHLVLCEFLASHGYVVATCPLIGTQNRLINLSVADLETEIRDLEFVIANARMEPFVHPDQLGVIGYDLGGMAGIVLSMRNPEVDAFLSYDAGILFGHGSGLPSTHPNYSLENFRIPWMHITQSRAIRFYRDEQGLTSLMDIKNHGDSFLLKVPTSCHGDFTSYAVYGIEKAIPGYWGPDRINAKSYYKEVLDYSLDFLDSYIKQDSESYQKLSELEQSGEKEGYFLKLEMKKGTAVPPAKDELVNMIISKGYIASSGKIEQARSAFADSLLFDKDKLNWLGYHFLYWWGREKEAINVFELIVDAFPELANGYDSLGEAYLTNGNIEKAIESYERSLELNPDNANAKAVLKRIKK